MVQAGGSVAATAEPALRSAAASTQHGKHKKQVGIAEIPASLSKLRHALLIHIIIASQYFACVSVRFSFGGPGCYREQGVTNVI